MVERLPMVERERENREPEIRERKELRNRGERGADANEDEDDVISG